jgi:hypothetical protein
MKNRLPDEDAHLSDEEVEFGDTDECIMGGGKT